MARKSKNELILAVISNMGYFQPNPLTDYHKAQELKNILRTKAEPAAKMLAVRKAFRRYKVNVSLTEDEKIRIEQMGDPETFIEL